MLKIGLTGNICSGKTTIAKIFQKLSQRVKIADADQIIHSFYRKNHPIYHRVARLFGKDILSKNREIDRKKLACLVFKSKQKRLALEKITHKLLYKNLKQWYKTLPKNSLVIVEAGLLIEKSTYKNFDKIIVVYAPYKICQTRAMKRGHSSVDFRQRWRIQMPLKRKIKYADFIIDNSGSLLKTKKQVRELFRLLQQ